MVRVRLSFEPDAGALGRQVGPILRTTAARLTRRIAAQARVRAPVRSGELTRSIHEMPVRMMSPFRAETGVEATAPHAAFVHGGTRPHRIHARNASVLAFKMNGRMVFRPYVDHPGTRAQPFLTDAADDVIKNDPTIT